MIFTLTEGIVYTDHINNTEWRVHTDHINTQGHLGKSCFRKFHKKVNFIDKFHENNYFATGSHGGKGEISFATMTHGWKVVIIDHIMSLLKTRINQWLLQNRPILLLILQSIFPESNI